MVFTYRLLFILPAERAGFEPAIHFWRIHAFQACLFNHSSISPIGAFFKSGANYKKNANHKRFQLQMYSFFSSSAALSFFYL